MNKLVIILICLWNGAVFSQPVIFTEDEFLSVIKQFHPVAKQAQLDVKIAEADMLRSRGGFDPVLTGDNSGKEVGGLNYYNKSQLQLKIPAWYGINFFAGHEKITGERVNPEQTTGTLSYVGFSIPLLQNLGMDKRRADLKQARIFRELAEIDRRVVINDLLRDARDTYWSWWKAHEQKQLTTLALINATSRFAMIRSEVGIGERAAIDTVEASTQLQNLLTRLIEIDGELIKQRINLSSFLWSADGSQFELPEQVKPEDWTSADSLSIETLTADVNDHPELVGYIPKLASLKIDRQLKFQSLLPEVTLKYNQLGYNFNAAAKNPWFENNQRFVVRVSVPLLLSQGRGDFRKANLKITQTRLGMDNKRVQLKTRLRQYLTDWQQSLKQIDVQQQLVSNLRSLQNGEELKFRNGETALFFINARELATISATQKLIDIKAASRKSLNALQWASGMLAR